MANRRRRAGRRPYWLAVLSALAVALALRLLPLWQSPLPFNPDGIHAARLAATAVGDGRFPLARMATDDLLFPPLLATVGSVLGVAPMRLGQPLSAFVGALPGVVGLAVARRLAVRFGWRSRRAFAAAVLAGTLLAVEGLYLHRSMPTDEQTVGLLLVPLAALAVIRGFVTRRRSWYLAGAVPMVAVAPLHNLDGMVLALVLTVAATHAVVRWRLRRAAPLVVLAGGFWLYFGGYHLLVERLTPAAIIQQTRLTDVPGLAVAWLVVVAFVAVRLRTVRPRTQRVIAGFAFATLFGLLAVNALFPVFPSTPATHPLLLAGLLPLAVPVAMAIVAAPELLPTPPEGPALSALLAAPFVLIGVSVTASMTPEYLATAYRSSTFLHFPVLVLASLGTVAVGARASSRLPTDSLRARTAIRVGMAVAVVIAAAASIPIAFGGLAVLNYKGVTTPAELDASEFATQYATDPWAGDNHLVRIQPPGGANGTETPVYGWLRGAGEPPACALVVQRSWTTVGAQFYPAPPERLSRPAYRELLTTRDVIYRGGTADRITAVAPNGTGC